MPLRMFAKCLANDGLTDSLADARPPQQAYNSPDMLKDGDNLSGTMGLQVAGPGTQSAGKINSIILGGPADIEGTLREDDVLIAIDGEEVGDKNFVEKIRGTDLLGSRNVITIDRQGELIHVSLTRTSAAHVSQLGTARGSTRWRGGSDTSERAARRNEASATNSRSRGSE